MSKRTTIQKLLSFFLLVIFTISTLPKIYFHDVIANHIDAVQDCSHPEKSKACLHQKVFHCNTENLVVTTPYVFAPVITGVLISKNYIVLTPFYSFSPAQHCFIHKESRGPPVV